MPRLVLTETQADEYLARIGVARPARSDLEALRTLCSAHLATTPFENLSIHLGEPIVLSANALFDKIVTRRRGGFCYELNGAFAALLTSLGYRVDLLSARVFGGGRFGPPFDHMTLRIDLGTPWLVDVGFGRFADAPLRLDMRGDQIDRVGTFRVQPAPGGVGDLDVDLDGEPQYRIDPRPYDLDDFTPTCWWQRTSPDSHFTRTMTCSLPTAAGRVTLSDDRLIITTGSERVERTLGSDAEVLDAYRTYFGVVLDQRPTLMAQLANTGSTRP